VDAPVALVPETKEVSYWAMTWPAGRAPRQQPPATRRRFFVFQPRRIDWWASAVQLAGTLFFNVSTGNAVRVDLTATAAHQHVWRPDAIGSICFLVASALAWFEVCHGWAAWDPRSWSWWITLLNLIGSVAFGVSAVAGYIDPATGQLRNAERSNLGTFIGALCFLAGALLLLPERTEEITEETTARSRRPAPAPRRPAPAPPDSRHRSTACSARSSTGPGRRSPRTPLPGRFPTRIALAMAVSAGFMAPMLGKRLVSTT